MMSALQSNVIASIVFETVRSPWETAQLKGCDTMGPTSASALESVSGFKEHYIRDGFRAFFRGVGRFLKMLVGWGSHSSQEAATHLLLMAGFCVEGIVLFGVISD